MHIKTHISFLIFTLGVLAFLLRPYMIYQLTAKDRSGSGAFNILQRSVKKKDEHHEFQADVANLLEQRSSSNSPLRRLLIPFVQFLLLFSRPRSTFRAIQDHQFFVVTRQRYALMSCLMI